MALTYHRVNKVMHGADDVPYFQSCLQWIATNLKYDRRNAYLTGFSGGGFVA